MADKRIHELIEEQTEYLATLLVQVEASDGSFTNAKKMAIENIYKKINQLDTASGVNTDSWLMRLDNGGGSEYKITLDNFVALFTETYEHTLYNSAGINVGVLYLERFGKLVNGIFDMTAGSGSSSLTNIYATIDGSSGAALSLPESLRPQQSVTAHLELSGNTNALKLNADGTGQFVINAFFNLSLSYITT